MESFIIVNVILLICNEVIIFYFFARLQCQGN
jgi:hypothetical protein